MSEDHIIREAALHAFVDNELDTEAEREVDTWLRQHPDELAEINAWKEQKTQLQAAFAPVLDEPIPFAIQETLNKSAKPKRSVHVPWRNIAAGIALLVVGIGVGLYAAPNEKKSKWPIFAQNAISSHLVFASDLSHPVELAAPQQNYLMAWVKHRVGKQLPPPTLKFAGFKFLGGRIVPHKDKPAALYLYENIDGKRITILIGQNSKAENTEKRVWTKKKLHCFFWFNGNLSFAVTSDIPKNKLKLVSDKVQGHFQNI